MLLVTHGSGRSYNPDIDASPVSPADRASEHSNLHTQQVAQADLSDIVADVLVVEQSGALHTGFPW